MLYLYRRVVFGVLTKDDVKAMLDLNWREIVVFVPMVAIVLWMGIYPDTFLKPIRPTIGNLIESVQAARDARQPHFAAR